MCYIVLVIGFVLLIKGADYFVEGSSNLAKYLKIPSLIIGLTIVSLGTSMPEVIVSTVASLKGSNDMAISNIIGSNIFNLLVVLGVSSLFKPLVTKKEVLVRDYVFMMFSIMVLIIFMEDKFLNHSSFNVISRGESLVLLLFLFLYLYIIIRKARNSRYESYIKHNFSIIDVFMFLLGLFSIILGGELVVRMSKIITINLGISETVVGLSVISIGTSIPELFTSVVAAFKGKTDIAIGNAIGSNIINVFLVLGISGTLSPVIISSNATLDAFILAGVSIFSYLIILKRKMIDKVVGFLMIMIYIFFLIFVIFR